MNIDDYEIFKYSENQYNEFINNGKKYYLNKHPYLDIVLTDYCNSNCNFCIADLIHNKIVCDINIFKEKILYAINNMNVKEVLLLGGEPTVSNELIPMINWLSNLNLDKIVMTTNGINLSKNINYRKKILSSGLTHLNISFMNVNSDTQKSITNSGNYVLKLDNIKSIYETANKYNVKVRINNNIFKNNNDNLVDILHFYNLVKQSCDSVKFSPLLKTDSFSVIDVKTKWVEENRLDDDYMLSLFNEIHKHYYNNYNISIIENDLQFGFVKNTMIPLRVPIILNWNFGQYTGMMDKVVNEHKINNIKLLPNNELSLSWNRELTEYFIKTI